VAFEFFIWWYTFGCSTRQISFLHRMCARLDDRIADDRITNINLVRIWLRFVAWITSLHMHARIFQTQSNIHRIR
jgi:hypothetical protein